MKTKFICTMLFIVGLTKCIASNSAVLSKPTSKFKAKRSLIAAPTKKNNFKLDNERSLSFLPTGRMVRFFNDSSNSYFDVADTNLFVRATNGDLLQEKSYLFNNNAYYLNSITSNMYGAQHEVLSSESKYFNGIELVNSNKSTYEYDNLLNNTLTTEYFWDTLNNVWITNFIDFSTYNGTMITKDIVYSLDSLGINLKPLTKTTITYTNNLISNVLMQNYINNNWVNDIQNDSIFWTTNSSDIPESFITLKWDTATSIWIETEKYVATFDTNNSLIAQEMYYAFNNGWQLTGQANFTYNSNNSNTSIIEYSNDTSGLVIEYMSNTTYNSDNTVSADFSYNYVNGVVNFVHKSAYAYDANKNQIFDSISHLDSGATQFTKDILVHIYFDTFETKISEVFANKITLFPNPAASFIQIQTNIEPASNNIIHVIDISGNVVLSQNLIANNQSLSIEHLQSGIYFVEIIGNKNVQRTKVVKQ